MPELCLFLAIGGVNSIAATVGAFELKYSITTGVIYKLLQDQQLTLRSCKAALC